RVVKNFFRQGSFDETPDHPLMSVTKEQVFQIITKKPITANAEELKQNNRSRSAKLRIAEKL
ncbi:MAG: 16S rRNA (cytosine(1402)-N(4))-methyltransferase, partial [Bacteroidota bacterium]|nr:16S rRNA (cytosine(1402)-N(4))-methyltransferase [Bacteroidota bacterium]